MAFCHVMRSRAEVNRYNSKQDLLCLVGIPFGDACAKEHFESIVGKGEPRQCLIKGPLQNSKGSKWDGKRKKEEG
ncbi:hypothetical protein RJT34_03120 [Clitoria ternatea]|uniref:Uncharacterized protein n=1 Tax=Clitoria ternatea TaxID=43366 RepID=A0AAN9KIW7_CLITE